MVRSSGARAKYEAESIDCDIQFPVALARPPAIHLHQYLCTFNYAWDHGQK